MPEGLRERLRQISGTYNVSQAAAIAYLAGLALPFVSPPQWRLLAKRWPRRFLGKGVEGRRSRRARPAPGPAGVLDPGPAASSSGPVFPDTDNSRTVLARH